MDADRFQLAKDSYAAGDYRAAAKLFLAAAGSEVEGAGAAFHMAGNSLLRLRRHADAITVYRQALRDELYDRRGALRANLAAAYMAVGEYPEAVEEYSAALEEPDYENRYRALQGMAGALFEMGKFTEAASAYRQAALDGDNPDPGKALNNLGLSFMAMKRPGDAAEAYKAALGFDDYKGRGRALANLGMAYFALGEYADAAKTFEKAVQLHGHDLSPAARDAFEQSRAALEVRPDRVVVEGWSTGEMPPVFDDMGSDVADDDLDSTQVVAIPTVAPVGDPASTGELFGDQENMDSTFFTVTDEEMREQDRQRRRAEKVERRDSRNPWTLVATVVLVIVVVAATVAAMYFSGLGFPTQSMTVNGLLEARAQGESVTGYWVAVPSADIDKEMGKIPGVSEFEIESVDRAPATSRAIVSITPDNGTPMRYGITLAREGVGWKVTGIEWPLTED